MLFYRANWVRVGGTKYQPPFAIVIGKDDEDLQFGSVERILVDRGVVWFEFTRLVTHQYLPHYHAKLPHVSSTSMYLIKQADILDFHSYGLPAICDDTTLQYVVLKNSVYTSED